MQWCETCSHNMQTIMVKVNEFILTLRTAGLLFPSMSDAMRREQKPRREAVNKRKPVQHCNSNHSDHANRTNIIVYDPQICKRSTNRYASSDVISLPEMTSFKAYPSDRSHRKPIQKVHRWLCDEHFIKRLNE